MIIIFYRAVITKRASNRKEFDAFFSTSPLNTRMTFYRGYYKRGCWRMGDLSKTKRYKVFKRRNS